MEDEELLGELDDDVLDEGLVALGDELLLVERVLGPAGGVLDRVVASTAEEVDLDELVGA